LSAVRVDVGDRLSVVLDGEARVIASLFLPPVQSSPQTDSGTGVGSGR
jgi:hypothetical protein